MVEQRGYELVDWDTDLFATGAEDEGQGGEDKAGDDSNSTFDSIAMKGEQLGELTKESWEASIFNCYNNYDMRLFKLE